MKGKSYHQPEGIVSRASQLDSLIPHNAAGR